MFRQFFRLTLYLLSALKRLVFRHPAFFIACVPGFVLGIWMVKVGFPAIIIPVNILFWGFGFGPVVNNYLNKVGR